MVGRPSSRRTGAVRRSLPLRLTLPCWYNFSTGIQFEGSVLQLASSWDALRQSDEAGFVIPQARAEWEALAERNASLGKRAEAIAELIKALGAHQVVSVGVGTGMLELLLKLRAPHVMLRCGDYGPATVALLQSHFGDRAEVLQMDLRDTSWAHPGELVLLNRVDMELDDDEWRRFFRLLAHAGVDRIVLVPCGLISPLTFVRQARVLVTGGLRGRALTRSGWMRTSRALISLFSTEYRLSGVAANESVEAWVLERRSSEL